MTSPALNDPGSAYSSRLASLKLLQSSYTHRHKQLGLPKLLAVFAVLAIFIWALATKAVSILWLIPPVAAFIVLEIVHLRVLRSLEITMRKIRFYESGIARLENRWQGSGDSGEQFLDPAHPYARDLDLFGKGSLFELLCTARTPSGQETLAAWLLQPAACEEIRDRQSAVTELRPRLDLREELAVLGEDIRAAIRPKSIIAWVETPPATKNPRLLKRIATLLSVLWILSLVLWAVWNLWPLALAISIVNTIFNSRYNPLVEAIAPAEKFAPDLKLLREVLVRLAKEEFSSSRLTALHAIFRKATISSPEALPRITRLLESLESRRHLVIAALDKFILFSAQLAFAVEFWRQKFGRTLRPQLAAVGEFEALSSLAGYHYEHPGDIFPEFANGAALFDAQALAHPLLPESQAVPNDVHLGDTHRLIIISGPNMAGKSTFIRAVGINAVLAQCGAPVRARTLRLSALQVTASICILDSLQGGVSHFYAEISRLKQITDLTKGSVPVLFLLDELLNGTNSHDRRIGAEAVVKSLVAGGAIGFVTTHDLALTQMVSDLPGQAANFHFEDHLEEGRLRFDYRLVPGVSQTTNALNLMRSIGLDL